MEDLKEYPEIYVFLTSDKGFEQGIKRARTAEQYSRLLAKYVGIERLETLTPKEMITFLKSLNLKVSTKKLVYCGIRRWYLLSGKSRHVRSLESEKPKFKSSRNIRYLSFEDVLKILRACECIEERLVYEVFICTGLRDSALLNLKISNLKLDMRCIHIEGELEGNKGKEDFSVKLPKKLTLRLESWINNRNKKEYLFNFDQDDKKSKSTKVWRISNFITKLGIKANISFLNPMYLRHTFGVIHYNTYKDILKTRNAMGQRSVSATERYAESVEVWETNGKWLLEEGFDDEVSASQI